ncbi:MAG TPA: branched-chain amino acid ABC transporter permease [Candidatus Sulfotelmatobacter sp.]|nr:branched-chain amino acid ABC transporter permease [Candidatus Sulfotelmatobacter sp.]
MYLQLIISGVALGSMYSLVALGFNLTYATSRTVNFSQGQSVMVGAVVAYAAYVQWGWPLPAAVALSLAALAAFGILVERVAVRPFFRAASIAWLLSTIAVGIIAENVAMVTFGKDARAFPSSLTAHPLMLFGAGVYPQELLLPVAGLGLMLGVEAALRRTLFGKTLRAVAFSHEAAALMGINVNRTIAACYGISSALAGVAGILIAPILNVSATMGTIIGLKAFAVAIIGGIESPAGIMTAGILYGVFESLVAGAFGTGGREILGFGLVILVLALRPWGLFGTPAVRRV